MSVVGVGFIGSCNESQETSVFCAIQSRDLAVLKLLLDSGANLEATDKVSVSWCYVDPAS